MKLDLYTQKGKKATTKVEVPDAVFGGDVNDKLLAQYIYVYLSNQREPIAHTKDRSAVRGGGKKPYRQKGTGNARAGSIRSPLWKGGGVTFGPTNERNWKKGLNRKMKVNAIRSAFSKLVRADKIKVLDKLALKEDKMTKQALEVHSAFGSPKKLMVITNEKKPIIVKAFANIKGAKVTQAGELNAYDLLTGGEVLLEKEAINYIEKWA